MGFFDRLSAGWKIAMSSFKVLKEKKELVIFPMLSSISILLIVGSFFVAMFSTGFFDDGRSEEEFNSPLTYLLMFVFYVVNYFIVVFFNMALVHCTRLYFRGEEVTVRAGLQFSMSRIGVIFSWALVAGTVGMLLRAVQENLGSIGKIIIGLIGAVWSVMTFFVVPIIAYENVGPIDAVKRSSQMMKEKWGESLGANFSFGLIQFVLMIVMVAVCFFAGSLIHPFAGIALAVVGAFIVFSVISAAQTVFISAIYHNVNGDLVQHFDQQMVDDLFTKK
ncbi:MAG: hypothetical protein EOO05_12540 [Chitinophagaceae bacterium]|jgi:hypothetical protein|nr:MAG: hypothetical protein EOO05_12540 [Chitinophagaceae bacterium]